MIVRKMWRPTYLCIQNVHAVCKGTPILSLLVKLLMVVGEKLLEREM